MTWLDDTGRPSDYRAGCEAEQAIPGYSRVTCNDRVVGLGNPYFIAFLKRMGRAFADGTMEPQEAVDRLIELIEEPRKWQPEFTAFLEAKT